MNAFWVILSLLAQTASPTDTTMEWLLDQATTQPTTTPATQPAAPASPFSSKPVAGEKQGTITLSDGSTHTGMIFTTPGKPIRVWDDAKKEYRDLSMEVIAKAEAKVLWERDEPEWRFKESGHDEKIFTGKTYPARETEYTFTLVNGDQVTGQAVAPVYVRTEGKATQFVINKRSKGDVDKKLNELIYIKSIVLDDGP